MKVSEGQTMMFSVPAQAVPLYIADTSSPEVRATDVARYAEMMLDKSEMKAQGEWKASALCAKVSKNADDVDVWFPLKAARYGNNGVVSTGFAQRVIEATGEMKTPIEICQVCPVQAACLTYAVNANLVGVWGGTSHTLRNEIALHIGLRDKSADAADLEPAFA